MHSLESPEQEDAFFQNSFRLVPTYPANAPFLAFPPPWKLSTLGSGQPRITSGVCRVRLGTLQYSTWGAYACMNRNIYIYIYIYGTFVMHEL